MQEEQKKEKRTGIWIVVAMSGIVLLGTVAYAFRSEMAPKGYPDYTIQKEQYYVEYSDQYDYWDVLTVEYPCLSGIDGEQEETINSIFYDTAMEKVNYWHLFPDEEVKALQEKYKIFSSDVRCEIPYHSQYLVSAHFREVYAPISPVYYVHITERAANMDLTTGIRYELSDIFQVNDGFLELWCKKVEAIGEYGDLIVNDADTRETFLAWFLNEDEETGMFYTLTPFFYMDENKDFVIGLSYDPKANKVANLLPMDNSFSAHFQSQELVPYRTNSEFWNLYEQSESAGEVIECEDLQENLWLGEDAGVWDYWGR